MSTTSSDFEIGQVIEAKGRKWYIADKKDVEGANGQKSVVFRLKSIDGIRAEWFVIPEIEALISPIKESKLPEPKPVIGHPFSQKLLTQAYRYTLRNDSLALTCLQNARVIPENYQLVPVLMALKQQDQVRMLIADGVGLGKTVEALLIVSELYNKEIANRILIICPANIREQWKNSLKRFFNLDAVIVDSTTRRKLESQMLVDQNVWNYYNIVIVSIDYIKQIYVLGEVIQYQWDLAIIDEAHNVGMPHNYFRKNDIFAELKGKARNQRDLKTYMILMKKRYDDLNEKLKAKSQGTLSRIQIEKQFRKKQEKEAYEMALIIANKVEHLLLLSATPHNGFTDSFASLLHLLDERCVSVAAKGAEIEIAIDREVAKKHVCQRSFELIKNELSNTDIFPIENEATEIIETNKNFSELVNQINDYCAMLVKFFGILEFDAKKKYTNMDVIMRWIINNLHKRFISSPYALFNSIKTIIRIKREKIQDAERTKKLDEIRDLSDEELEYDQDQITRNMLDADVDVDKTEDEVDEDLAGKVMEFPLEMEKMAVDILGKILINVNKYMGNFGEWVEEMYTLFSTKLVLQDQEVLSYERLLAQYLKEKRVKIDSASEKKAFLTKYLESLNDTKLRFLIDYFEKVANLAQQKEPDCNKFIVFTRFSDSLKYLQFHLTLLKLLDYKYLKDLEIFTIHGKMPFYSREQEYNKFRKADKAILISTDCMAEGIDLQYSANILFNYELTWNPNRISQRNGRISRFRQPKKYVYLRLLILKHSIEQHILNVIKDKLESMKNDVGLIPTFFLNTIDLKESFSLDEGLLKYTNVDRKNLKKLLEKDDIEQEKINKYIEKAIAGNIQRQIQMNDAEALNTILQDSFYKQEDVKISDVKEKMVRFHEQYGSTEELLEFLKNGLEKYGLKLERAHPEKAIYQVKPGVNSERFTQFMDDLNHPKDQPLLLTTDPLIGVRNDEIEEIKLNSPIITLLFDKIKRDCFVENEEFYGRIVNRGIPQSFATSHVVECNILFRFAVHMNRPIVFEELHSIAMQLRPERILTLEELRHLYSGEPINSSLIEGDKTLKFIQTALHSQMFQQYIAQFQETRRLELIQERERFWNQLAANEVESIRKEDFLNVKAPSWDILTITLHTRELNTN